MGIGPYLAIYSELSCTTYASFGGGGSHSLYVCECEFVHLEKKLCSIATVCSPLRLAEVIDKQIAI